MYEKVKVENENTGVPPGECHFCERPKSVVICATCRSVVPNVRHRRTCAEHPREFFLMDIHMCRNCKGHHLLELGLDEIPDDLIAVLSPPESPAGPSSGSGTLSPSPPHDSARPSSSGLGALPPSPPLETSAWLSPSTSRTFFPSAAHASTGLSPIKENSNPVVESIDVIDNPSKASPAPLSQRNTAERNLVPGRGRGLKRQRVSITQIQAANAASAQGAAAVARVVVPAASSTSTQAPATAPTPVPVAVGGSCVCTRQVHFLVCSMCGYFSQGVRKYIPCPTHPKEQQGIKFCPECGTTGENIDETCF